MTGMTDEIQNPTVQEIPSPHTQLQPARPMEISVQEMKVRLDKFLELKQAVLKDHIMDIHGKAYIKKSGWRVAAVVFGLADEITRCERQDRPDGSFTITYHVRCTDPVGRTSIGVASCDSKEKEKSGNRQEHDTATMAHTRAKNRAISDIIGTGEVSAEEMMTSDGDKTNTPNQNLKPFPSRYAGNCKHCDSVWQAGTNIFKVNDHWCVNPKCTPKMQATDKTDKTDKTDNTNTTQKTNNGPSKPTDEQLEKLKALEYDGLPPRTRYEAQIAITEMQQKQKEKQQAQQAEQIRQAQEAQNA